jgi:hypothetical protein
LRCSSRRVACLSPCGAWYVSVSETGSFKLDPVPERAAKEPQLPPPVTIFGAQLSLRTDQIDLSVLARIFTPTSPKVWGGIHSPHQPAFHQCTNPIIKGRFPRRFRPASTTNSN